MLRKRRKDETLVEYARNAYRKMNDLKPKFKDINFKLKYQERNIENIERTEEYHKTFTIEEFAETMNVNKMTIYRWIDYRFLPEPIFKVKVGGTVRKHAKAYHIEEAKALIKCIQVNCKDRTFVPIRDLDLAAKMHSAIMLIRESLPEITGA